MMMMMIPKCLGYLLYIFYHERQAETSVILYHTTRCYSQYGHSPAIHHHANVRSRIGQSVVNMGQLKWLYVEISEFRIDGC